MWSSRLLSNQCLRAARSPRSSRQVNLSLSSLINNALCITLSVTSAMLVISDTPVAICSHALMDIEARPRQCANTMTINTQAGFQMTFAIVFLCVELKCQKWFLCLINEMLLIKQLRPCLNM